MQILIKSFNRAFYLDRCLQTIENFVDGKYTVKILDDGTPERIHMQIQEEQVDFSIVLKQMQKIEMKG